MQFILVQISYLYYIYSVHSCTLLYNIFYIYNIFYYILFIYYIHTYTYIIIYYYILLPYIYLTIHIIGVGIGRELETYILHITTRGIFN